MTEGGHKNFGELAAEVKSGRLWAHGKPRVAVIGAGISGLLAYRALLQRDIVPVVLERRQEVGGIWSFSPHFATYQGLIQNTCVRQMALDGHPAPRPVFGGHHYSRDEYAPYVAEYARLVDDPARIFLGCNVGAIAREAEGAVLFISDGGRVGDEEVALDVDHVIYAGGLQHKAHVDRIPGENTFAGMRIHSSQCTSIENLRGLDVLIVGFGNTAADLAGQLAPMCGSVTISCRNPTWVVPRSVAGRPTDELVSQLYRDFGFDYSTPLYTPLMDAGSFQHGARAREVNYKTHRIVTSGEILPLLHSRRISITPKLQLIEQRSAHFEDGQSRPVSAVIFCTGYEAAPPLLQGVEYSSSPLVASVLHPLWPRLWFVGLTPIWGSAAAIATRQARVVADAIRLSIPASEFHQAVEELRPYDKVDAVLPLGFEIVEFNSYAEFLDELLQRRVRRRHSCAQMFSAIEV